MPKLNLSDIQPRIGTGYPAPFNAPCLTRSGLSVSDAAGLTQFGAHLMTLPPGSWSSQRHHHSHEDEIIYIISGHPTLYEGGEGQRLSPGDITAHPMGDGIGHHMKNQSEQDVVYFVIGGRNPQIDHVTYPDVDMDLPPNGMPFRIFQRKDGTSF